MLQKLKRSFASVSIVALLISMLVTSVFAQANGPFPDVGDDHENLTAIQFMKDSGVFEGYPDGTYQPDRVLNRAEQLKVYMLLHGLDPSADTYKNCFPDVTTEWFARFVCYAEDQGWVEGYPDGTFKPAQEVNKVEALKMLGEIQGWDMTVPTVDPFTDTPATEWYAKYVAFAKAAGLLVEKSGNFNPAEGLTRATTAELLFRSLAVYALEEDAYSPDLDDEILLIDVMQLPPPPGLQLLGDAPEAEFGDAPEDGNAGYAGSFSVIEAAFPTLYDTENSLYGPGAHALDSSMEWLGDPNENDSWSYEVDADDVADPDGAQNLVNEDGFDDGVTGLNIVLTSIPPPAALTLDVTVEDDAPDVPRYINALIDLNMDGEWSGTGAGGEPEWVVKNYVVNVTPGTTETITTDNFAYANGLILTPTTWMRVVLSREPIDASEFGNDGWDGSGAFDYGEVEDYYVQLPDWDDGSGGSGGGPGGPGGGGAGGGGGRGLIWGKPAPIMVCPSKVRFPDGANSVIFSCGIWNFGGAGDTRYDLWRESGLVDVLLTTRIVPMPTAPPGFFVPGMPGGVAGVMGNPHREWFIASNRDGTPSTWGYTVVGIDPESTVDESIVDLGLMPGDKDEGYEAQDGTTFEDFLFWSDEVDEAYLYDPTESGPTILDVAFFEMDNSGTPGEYHFVALADVYDPDTSAGGLNYAWEAPTGCGSMEVDGNQLDWTFPEGDMDECLGNGLSLTVNDGTNFVTDSFFDVFVDLELVDEPTEPVENLPPVILDIDEFWLNNMEDDPHLYTLTVLAEDPDTASMDLTYNWTGVSCGSLIGDTNIHTVQWSYPLADMGECSSATVTVEVGDGDNVTTDTLPIF